MNNDSHCQIYGPLISALIDDELDALEQSELQTHLKGCAECRSELRELQTADAMLRERVERVESEQKATLSAFPSTKTDTEHRPNRRSLFSVWRLLPMAVAASLLGLLLITLIDGPQPATAHELTTEQVVKPMKELHWLNAQQQRDQELMLQTLGMDLRSLRIEISQLAAGSPERTTLSAQVETMIEKVRQYEARSSASE